MVCQSALPTFSSSQHLLYSHLISQTIIWATLLTSCFIFRVNQCPRCVIMKILRPLQDISRMTYCNMQKIWKYKLQNKRVKRWEILLSARTNNKIAKKKKPTLKHRILYIHMWVRRVGHELETSQTWFPLMYC